MKIAESSLKRVENTVGKGEIARYEQFLLSPKCFQKACFLGVSKGVIVWEWDNKELRVPCPCCLCSPLIDNDLAEFGVNTFITSCLNKPLFFTCLPYQSFENTVAKGEIARHEQFLLFPQCFFFFPFGNLSAIFIKFKIVICKTLSIWKSLKFVVWKRVYIRDNIKCQ